LLVVAAVSVARPNAQAVRELMRATLIVRVAVPVRTRVDA